MALWCLNAVVGHVELKLKPKGTVVGMEMQEVSAGATPHGTFTYH